MSALCQTIRTALVLATALLTLVSGITRFSCVCPDGRVQADLPVVFGCSGCRFVAAANRAVSAQLDKRSCCTAHAGATNEKKAASTQLNSLGCRKTLSLTDVMAVPSAPTLDDHSSNIGPPPVWADAGSTLSPEAGAWQSSSLNCTSPPPTDLVVRLQRLLV